METTSVVGVTFDGRQQHIKEINPLSDDLVAVREPENKYDKNAIHIYIEGKNGRKSCGYINRFLAKELAPQMDAGKQLSILNYFIRGAGKKESPHGVLIEYVLQ